MDTTSKQRLGRNGEDSIIDAANCASETRSISSDTVPEASAGSFDKELDLDCYAQFVTGFPLQRYTKKDICPICVQRFTPAIPPLRLCTNDCIFEVDLTNKRYELFVEFGEELRYVLPCSEHLLNGDTPFNLILTSSDYSRQPSRVGLLDSIDLHSKVSYFNFSSSDPFNWLSSGLNTFDAAHPPERNWIPLGHPERYVPTARFTIMCYNVLCDKYCTRQQYGYTPSWALHWDYRKKGILEEIKHYHADIISLQEVETDQYHAFFLPELASIGYDGIFSPKSRARVMNEKDRGGVDGCAIFWKTSKFRLVKQHLIEFNKLAVANAEGSENVLNRVMTKDNIGLCALLQTKRDVWVQGQCHLPEGPAHQLILISTVHLLWDPEFSDVKLIQSIMLMSELTDIIRNAHQCQKTIWETCKADVSQIPVILCGDLNSLPDSGVVEFLSTGKVAVKHPDFKDINYEKVLETFSHTADYDYLTHGLNLTQAYTTDHMKYTNYTYDFKGFIDYVFASEKHLKPLGVLGPLDENWFTENNIVGCPHPYVPSDHFSLLVEFEMPSLTTFSQKASQNIVVRW